MGKKRKPSKGTISKFKHREMVCALRDYIALLTDELGEFAAFALIHGMVSNPRRVKKGKELRAEIRVLQKELGLGVIIPKEFGDIGENGELAIAVERSESIRERMR